MRRILTERTRAWAAPGVVLATLLSAVGGAAAETAEVPRLGLTLEDVSEALAAERGVAPYGVIVLDAAPADGAEAAPPFAAGDQILLLDGAPTTARAFADAVAGARPGASLTAAILRGGEGDTVAIRIADPIEARPRPMLGVRIDTTEGEDGVRVASLFVQGSAFRSGVEVGDVILAVNEAPTPTAETFTAVVRSHDVGDVIRLSVLRDGERLRIDTPLVAWPDRVLAEAPTLFVDSGGHADIVRELLFHPDGERLISGGADRTIRVWRWRTGATERIIRIPGSGSDGKISALALSPDGRLLAAAGTLRGSGDRSSAIAIALIDLETGETLFKLPGHLSTVLDVAFLPDGGLLAAADANGYVVVYDLDGRATLWGQPGHDGPATSIAFAAEGRVVATAGSDGAIRLWDAFGGAFLAEGASPSGAAMTSLAASGDLVASGDAAGGIQLWNAAERAGVGELPSIGGKIGVLRFSPDGSRLLATCGEAACGFEQRVFDVASGEVVARQANHGDSVLAAAWAADGVVATAGLEGLEILLWDGETGGAVPPGRLAGEGYAIWAVGFSSDGTRLGWGPRPSRHVEGRRNPIGFAIDLPDGANPAFGAALRIDDDSGFIRSRIEADGVRLRRARGGPLDREDGVLVVSRTAGGGGAEMDVARIVRTERDGYAHVAVALAPGGRIVSGGLNGHLIAYGLDGREVGRFVGHTGAINSVAPSPNGRLLASASSDQTIKIWSLDTYELVLTIAPRRDGSYVVWTPQGFYDGRAASDAAAIEDRIGWLLSYEDDPTPTYVSARDLGSALRRPEVLARALELASSEAAVEEATGGAGFAAILELLEVPGVRR